MPKPRGRLQDLVVRHACEGGSAETREEQQLPTRGVQAQNFDMLPWLYNLRGYLVTIAIMAVWYGVGHGITDWVIWLAIFVSALFGGTIGISARWLGRTFAAFGPETKANLWDGVFFTCISAVFVLIGVLVWDLTHNVLQTSLSMAIYALTVVAASSRLAAALLRLHARPPEPRSDLRRSDGAGWSD